MLNRIWQIELKCGIIWAQELEFPTFKMIVISSRQLCPRTSWKIGLSLNHLRADSPGRRWLQAAVPHCSDQLRGQSSAKAPKVFSVWSRRPNSGGCVFRAAFISAQVRESAVIFSLLRQTVDTSAWLKRAQRAKGSGGGGGGGGRAAVEGNDTWQRGGEIFVWRGEKSCTGALIEGCFKAVRGWQFGIIMVICLRGRHPDRLLMSATCAVCPKLAPGRLHFHCRVESVRSFFSAGFIFHGLGLQEGRGTRERGGGCLLVWLLCDVSVTEWASGCLSPILNFD